MNIPLYAILQIQYPTATIGVGNQIVLADHGDGNGPFIQSWAVPGVEEPTADQLSAWQTDANTIAAYQAQLNIATNANILNQLKNIDSQSIRALRESDPTYLATLTSQAVALRAQLLPMTAAEVIAAQSSGSGS